MDRNGITWAHWFLPRMSLENWNLLAFLASAGSKGMKNEVGRRRIVSDLTEHLGFTACTACDVGSGRLSIGPIDAPVSCIPRSPIGLRPRFHEAISCKLQMQARVAGASYKYQVILHLEASLRKRACHGYIEGMEALPSDQPAQHF